MAITMTSAALLERYRSDSTGFVPMSFGASLNQGTNSAGTTGSFTVPEDKVLLITQMVLQADPQGLLIGSGVANVPLSSRFQAFSYGSPNSTSHGDVTLMSFNRNQSYFGGSPMAQTAPPANCVSWKPKYPIVVGPGLEWRAGATLGDYGNASACYGYLVDRDQASVLGFPTNPTGVADERRIICTTQLGGTDNVLVAGRAGRSIRVLDVFIRGQAQSEAVNDIRLYQDDGVTERDIWRFFLGNPSEMLDMRFSPDWYLKAGAALHINSTVNNEVTVTIVGEYVDDDEIPWDAWWGTLDPTLPTPSLGTSGTLSAFVQTSTELVPYFPGRDAVASADTPPTYTQYVVNGYGFSSQQELGVVAPDKIWWTISGGAAAGSITAGAYSLDAQSNVQIAPVFMSNAHDMNVTHVVDEIAVPIQGDMGSPSASGDPGGLWVDTVGLGGTGLTPTGASESVWSVSAWGRMTDVPQKHLTNRGE